MMQSSLFPRTMAGRQRKHLHFLSLVSFLVASSTLPAGGIQIRLAGSGSSRCSGRVEVYHNNTWGTVCDDGWGLNDAIVVCRQLDCGKALGAPQSAHFGEGTGQIWLDHVACKGNEEDLNECQHDGFEIHHDCEHFEDAGVNCSGVQVRLAGSGSTRCSGRVEVYHNNIWGTVCDDGWDLNDAMVVCRQLECGTALDALPSAHFGEGTGQIWLDDVACTGSEESLSKCRYRGFGTHDCGHSKDAVVICSGLQLRLAGSGSTQCSGRVEVYLSNTWGTVCDDSWDLNDAMVVCRQLGCGKAKNATQSAHFGEGTGQIWLDEVACNGTEESLNECRHRGFGTHNCKHAEDAGVVCSGGLPKPRISIMPAGVVTRGQKVSIVCSTSAELVGGTFILTDSSGSFRKTQTSNTNSAAFTFLEVDFDNEGWYQCQHAGNISGETLKSRRSDAARLTVTDPTNFIIRHVILLLVVLLMITVICFIRKAMRRQKPKPQESIEMDYHHLSVSRGPVEEEVHRED